MANPAAMCVNCIKKEVDITEVELDFSLLFFFLFLIFHPWCRAFPSKVLCLGAAVATVF
jgi:hypothetical protein